MNLENTSELHFWISTFSFLVVAEPPLFFNNNQWKEKIAFWRQRLNQAAIACITIPQAETRRCSHLLPTSEVPPLPLFKAEKYGNPTVFQPITPPYSQPSRCITSELRRHDLTATR